MPFPNPTFLLLTRSHPYPYLLPVDIAKWVVKNFAGLLLSNGVTPNEMSSLGKFR
jgi:hypothetical protein